MVAQFNASSEYSVLAEDLFGHNALWFNPILALLRRFKQQREHYLAEL